MMASTKSVRDYLKDLKRSLVRSVAPFRKSRLTVDTLAIVAANSAADAGTDASLASHRCRTSLTSFSQTWSIDDLPFYFDESFIGPPIIYSAEFVSPKNAKLAVYMNLKVRSTAHRNAVSLFINLNAASAITGQSYCLVFKFSIIDAQGAKQHSRASIKQFDANGLSWGWNNYISMATLLDPANGLLVDGRLTILCEVKELDCNVPPAVSESSAAQVGTVSKPLSDEFSRWKASLYTCGQLFDVMLVVDGTELPAHKLVLSSASPVFAAMFNHEMTEKRESRVEMVDMRLDVLQKMLDFIYYSEVEDLEMVTEELLVAADKFQMDKLKQLCEESLISRLTLDDAAEMLQLATVYRCERLKTAVDGLAKQQLETSLRSLQSDTEASIKACQMLKTLLRAEEIVPIVDEN